MVADAELMSWTDGLSNANDSSRFYQPVEMSAVVIVGDTIGSISQMEPKR